MKKRLISGIIAATIILGASTDVFAGYYSTLRKWTRNGRSFEYNTLDANLIWYATLISDELVTAQRAEKWARMKETDGIYVPPADRVSFFVSIYTAEAFKEFSMNESSVWRIVLVGNDGSETKPLKIEPVTITPYEIEFYPHMDRWSKAYIVEFPKVELGSRFSLILRSIPARSTITWRIKK